MPLTGFLSSVVGWLRAGYPDGIPATDYIPLVALLARRLTHDEVQAIADELARVGDPGIDDIDIGTMITKVTAELPSEEDIDRVRVRLARGGWPLGDQRTAS
ncbi:Protein of unknown function [Friedmanniella luteola]|uniref:DUF3349 domain-containing protein n=1 Tax=Friedmanniella luteola TaxID=546871 RepID=A0A1H1V0C1_9ACTN|nr:DUF3349 domain-containing protein [Friedmanniella luteola]SDS78244.1 Protein of unknown function [Friedmanniella luteola]